jgi:hypothetical protein
MTNHPYKKLKSDYDHLLGRTWDLFCFGIEKEAALETAVANAWKLCDDLMRCEVQESEKNKILAAKKYFEETLKEHGPNDANT